MDCPIPTTPNVNAGHHTFLVTTFYVITNISVSIFDFSLSLPVSTVMSLGSNPPYKGLERAFCIRMKSTLTKRGCHFKSSGYRVQHAIVLKDLFFYSTFNTCR